MLSVCTVCVILLLFRSLRLWVMYLSIHAAAQQYASAALTGMQQQQQHQALAAAAVAAAAAATMPWATTANNGGTPVGIGGGSTVGNPSSFD